VFQFFSVAYLTHKKGMDVLLDAMAKVIKQYQNVVLLIGGDGEVKAALQEQVERLKLQHCVEFLGSLSRSEVISDMRSCDAFVLASRHETFGIVYLEAMACGKPIIMTDTDAHLTIVNEQTGLVVSRESVDDLALAMIRMIENRDMYQSELIRKYCFEKFSASVISSKLIEVYRKVLGGLKHA
jgi:glycosyltransferase involved in cell wall biosynthesis